MSEGPLMRLKCAVNASAWGVWAATSTQDNLPRFCKTPPVDADGRDPTPLRPDGKMSVPLTRGNKETTRNRNKGYRGQKARTKGLMAAMGDTKATIIQQQCWQAGAGGQSEAQMFESDTLPSCPPHRGLRGADKKQKKRQLGRDWLNVEVFRPSTPTVCMVGPPHPQETDDASWRCCWRCGGARRLLVLCGCGSTDTTAFFSVPQNERRIDTTSMWREDMDKATNEPRDARQSSSMTNCRVVYHSDEESSRANSGEYRISSYIQSMQHKYQEEKIHIALCHRDWLLARFTSFLNEWLSSSVLWLIIEGRYC
ncbi:hypothetical protein V8F20_001202 [Naviculisporaceae sp. PSN 640]